MPRSRAPTSPPRPTRTRDSSATSKQIVPVNANVPVQILSFGHNGGDTAESNSSSAQSNAFNQAGTFQGLGQAQGLLG